ncbi:MAG: ArsR/SmtB family transcription factor [Micromonosporaceae bacterium]
MLRIVFTGDDVARTRIAAGADPLWELVLALHMLLPQRGDLLFADWRRQVLRTLRGARLGRMLPLLLQLNPNVGYFPDFFTPPESGNGLESGLEAIRATPRTRLRHDILRLASSRQLPPATRTLADGDPELLTELTEALRTCYRLLVAPYRRGIDTALDRERSLRMHALAAGGVERLFGSLGPWASWYDGELRIPSHRDQRLLLDGRGLVLVPAYFCVGGPITLYDPQQPPVLVYPASRQPDVLPGQDPAARGGLRALVGTTRAAVLEAIGSRPVTTSALARRVGISAASASEHATVLRRAGLLVSQRDGNRMLHHLTSLGHAFLAAPGEPTGT